MALLAQSTEIYENGSAEFARLRAIEDWEQIIRAPASQGGRYSYSISRIENQTSEFETADDDFNQVNASDTLHDTDRAYDNCFFTDDQTSSKSESQPSLIEEFLPFFRKKTVENELRGYLLLGKGWGGVNSVAAPELAVENAVSFLYLFTYDLKQPTPMVAADGEVGLYWRHQSAYVELEFAGDGIMFGYGCDLNGNEAFIDDVSLDSHEEIEKAIATVSKIVSQFPIDDD
ncbi:MAG: hypothetical protein B1H11_02535 [Desulfobacteraceae bacterium 4484_190.1]|nr:MAG: hypothetical protein B1H11_02535 [Desulfobacteraceae bacterium 4484_190.1]